MESSKKATNIIFGLAIAALLFTAGFKVGEFKSTGGTSIASTQLGKGSTFKNYDPSLFDQAVQTLNQKYVDRTKLDSKKQFYGAIKGVVASVGDPYTFFMTPEENKTSKDDLGGIFEGIGAQLGLKDNKIVVVAPLPSSPAEKAGIRSGDYIDKVDGKATRGWTLVEAVGKIRGPKGTKVTLTISRPNKTFDANLVRDSIHVDSVELSYMSNVGIIKVNQFSETTNDEWDKAVDDISEKWQNKTIKGLVIDLRDNPGGFLDSAVYLSSEFLPQGKLVVKQESTVNGSHDYTVTRDGRLLDIPMSVLINKGSASASEIFSGAMRDHKRATLVGEKSFGKGSVQEALDLKNGAGLHVTVAKWILPKGEWINGKGIEPEVKEELKIIESQDTANTPSKDQLRAQDNQLKKAIDVVTK